MVRVNIKTFCYLFLCSGLVVSPLYGAEKNAVISDFSHSGISGWDEKSFKGNTQYKVIRLNDKAVLQAVSSNSASGMFKEKTINLKQTPYLNWRWRIESKINSGDETKKTGDDYAARLYLVIDGGVRFWKTRALNYVWANESKKGAVWNNAYAGKSVKMFAVRSGSDSTKQWYHEKRNVYQDLKQVFGEEFNQIDAVAIMTDTDNSGSAVKAYYADIYFSKD